MPLQTGDATLTLAMGNNPLEVGQHSFSLTVTDDSGNESTAATVSVIVRDDQRPTAVLEVRELRSMLAFQSAAIDFN